MTVPLPKRCRECDAVLAERQRWCVACGAAPRIALAPAPGARAVVAWVISAAALACLVVVLAIVV